jgi:hypothetical protein
MTKKQHGEDVQRKDNTMNNNGLYRQGDVYFRRVDALPEGKRTKRKDGAVAYGEVTGHSHRLAAEHMDCAEVVDIGDEMYVVVSEEGLRLKGLNGVVFDHEDHGVMRSAETGVVEVLPAGVYRAWIQREYSPDAIRNVID